MAIARITKEELTDLRIKRNALATVKAQYLLAERGFSANIGEVIRRYKRNEDERLRINLETGDIEVASPSTVGAIGTVDGLSDREILQQAKVTPKEE